MSLDQIKASIDVTVEAFPTLRGVVFTGGECFLLRSSLVKAVEHARKRGLGTRCVSNGY